jgi:hypothetical protein
MSFGLSLKAYRDHRYREEQRARTAQYKFRDDSFICAQANITIYYNSKNKSLYVFGHNDTYRFCHITQSSGRDTVVQDTIVNPAFKQSHSFRNCSLFKFKIDSKLKFEASGPNCSYFSYGSQIYLFASASYIAQLKKAVERMYVPQTESEKYKSADDGWLGLYRDDVLREQISCSRTHSAILYETSIQGDLRLIQFNERGVGSEQYLGIFNKENKWKIFCGINCTYVIHNDIIKVIPLDAALITSTSDKSVSLLPDRFIKGVRRDKKIIKIVCGGNHNMVLYDDGSFDGWGDDSVGQIPKITDPKFQRPGPTLRVTDIVCGNQHTLLLLENGQVFGFGNNTFLQNYDYFPRAPSKVIQIACGDNHSLALLNNEELMGWGRTLENQLGNIKKLLTKNLLIFFEIHTYAKYLEDAWTRLNSSKGGSIKKKNLKYKKKISKKLKY